MFKVYLSDIFVYFCILFSVYQLVSFAVADYSTGLIWKKPNPNQNGLNYPDHYNNWITPTPVNQNNPTFFKSLWISYPVRKERQNIKEN